MQFGGLEVVRTEAQVPIDLGDDCTTTARQQAVAARVLGRVRQGEHGGIAGQRTQAAQVACISPGFGVGILLLSHKERCEAIDDNERSAADAFDLAGNVIGVFPDADDLIEEVNRNFVDIEAQVIELGDQSGPYIVGVLAREEANRPLPAVALGQFQAGCRANPGQESPGGLAVPGLGGEGVKISTL